jgi:hypothetical protein
MNYNVFQANGKEQASLLDSAIRPELSERFLLPPGADFLLNG